MTALTGADVPVELGNGVVLRAPGLLGEATLQTGLLGGTRGDGGTEALRNALQLSGFLQMEAVEVIAEELPVADSGGLRSDSTGEPGMQLVVDAVSQEFGQALMAVDEQGVITWHFPEAGSPPGRTTFTVSRTVATDTTDEVDAADDGSRGIGSIIGTKLLQLVAFPLLERGIELVADRLAKALEDRVRPRGLRLMTPAGFATTGSDPLEGGAWGALDGGRALLLLHGTNSTSHGAFGGLGDDGFGALHAAYGGRVMALDHHTLGSDLTANVADFLERLPSGRRLEVDVVAHSRGGLVARALADATRGSDSPIDVRRVVYVATPNDGTALADADHLRTYLNRVTTMLNLIPDGPWSVVTDSLTHVLELVRVVGSGAVGGLSGLQTMLPGGPVLQELGWVEGEGRAQFAVDVDFEPTGRLLRLVRGADAVVDSVFGSRSNDLVVPTAGVSTIAARQGFSIPADRRLSLGRTSSAWHCSLLAVPAVQEQLVAWLAPEVADG